MGCVSHPANALLHNALGRVDSIAKLIHFFALFARFASIETAPCVAQFTEGRRTSRKRPGTRPFTDSVSYLQTIDAPRPETRLETEKGKSQMNGVLMRSDDERFSLVGAYGGRNKIPPRITAAVLFYGFKSKPVNFFEPFKLNFVLKKQNIDTST